MTEPQEAKKTAEDYAFEALAAKMDKIILYNKEDDLNMWLDKYPPSKVSRLDRIGWIEMQSDKHPDDCEADYDMLQKDWEELKVSGDPVDFEKISELAKQYGVLKGSWLFHVQTGDKVDILWRKVATEFAYGVLADVATKVCVSPTDPSNGKYVHVIMVKHPDFTNEAEVFKLNDALRSAGIKTKLMYKPKIYSYLGIYRNNDFKLRPSVYMSQYDILKRVSKITHLHKEPYGTEPDPKSKDPSSETGKTELVESDDVNNN